MLVVTRKAGQSVRVGTAVTLTVVRIGRGRVKLGIDAPPDFPVARGELPERQSRPQSKPVRTDKAPRTANRQDGV